MTRRLLSKRTARLLSRSGWSAHRNIDITEAVTELRSAGYEVYAIVQRFLTSFLGLTIDYPHYRDPTVVDRMHFDAVAAARNVFPEHVAAWSATLGQELCPIGEAFRENMTLVMSEVGEVFAGRDDLLLKVGSSGEEAVEALCSGAQLQQIA